MATPLSKSNKKKKSMVVTPGGRAERIEKELKYD